MTAYMNGNGQPRAVNTGTGPASDQQCPTFQRQNQSLTFRRATKRDAKLRLAVAGPSGSGKTYTLLKLATELGGPIAVADTERGSAEKYADLFEFDILSLSSFNPDLIPELIAAAAVNGYKVLIIDSLSHFWTGVDGELDQIERVKMRMRDNGWAAWREITPKHNRLIDAMLAAPLHILVSMRVKTEWIVETDDRGKSKPRKIGLQPVMRDGIEYEFDVCGDMDQENNLVITKSRCPELAGQVFAKPGKEVANILTSWLSVPQMTPAQKTVAEKRIDQLQRQAADDQPPSKPVASNPPKPWRTMGELKQVFEGLREQVGEVEYFAELDRAGVAAPVQFANSAAAMESYTRLLAIAQRKEVA